MYVLSIMSPYDISKSITIFILLKMDPCSKDMYFAFSEAILPIPT